MSSSKFVKGLTISTVSLSGLYAFYLPNSIFLDKIKNVMVLYKLGVPASASSNVTALSETVMNDLKLPKEDQEEISLFPIPGFGFFHAGSVWKHKILGGFNKAIIGTPLNLDWESFDDKIKQEILVDGNEIKWSSEGGKKLQNSLIFSDKARKFALAQQICYVTHCEPLVKGLITASLLYFTLVCTYGIRTEHFLKTKTRPVRLAFYGTVAVFQFVLWIVAKDFYTCWLQKKVDDTVANIGKDYVEGGLDFYESVLKTNIALRNLALTEKRLPKFTHYGNEEMLFRRSSIPLTERRDYFKKLMN